MKNFIMGLITRVLANKFVKFDGSKVYYWDVPMMAMPFDNFASMQYDLETKYGVDIKKIFYSLGKIQGKNGTNILLKKFNITPKKEDLTFYIEQTKFIGIGKIELLEFDTKNAIFRVILENSPHCAFIFKKNKKLKNSFCDYQRGLIVGAVEAIMQVILNLNLSFDGVETKCLAKGDDICEFVIKKTEDFNENLELKNDLVSFIKKKENLNMLLRNSNILKNKNVTMYHQFLKQKKLDVPFKYNSEGLILFLDTKLLITPMDIFVLLYFLLNKIYGSKINKDFYNFGNFFADSIFECLKNNFPFHTKTKSLNVLLQQMGLFGFGLPLVVNSNFSEGIIITNLTDSTGLYYKEIIGLNKNVKVDFFVSGYINRIIELFLNKKTTTEEINCIVGGSGKCVFKTIYKQ